MPILSLSIRFVEEAFDDYKKPANRSTEKSRRLLYLVLTWVLGQIDYINPDETWRGAQLWAELNKDPLFRRFLDHRKQDRNESFASNMAFSILRFNQSRDALENARGYLEESIEYARTPVAKAPHIFALRLMDATNGKIAEAKSQMQQAADFDPQGHTFSADFAKTFANDVEYQVWRIAAKRVNLNFEEISKILSPKWHLQALLLRINNDLSGTHQYCDPKRPSSSYHSLPHITRYPLPGVYLSPSLPPKCLFHPL